MASPSDRLASIPWVYPQMTFLFRRYRKPLREYAAVLVIALGGISILNRSLLGYVFAFAFATIGYWAQIAWMVRRRRAAR
jgi:hypothetical protein